MFKGVQIGTDKGEQVLREHQEQDARGRGHREDTRRWQGKGNSQFFGFSRENELHFSDPSLFASRYSVSKFCEPRDLSLSSPSTT